MIFFYIFKWMFFVLTFAMPIGVWFFCNANGIHGDAVYVFIAYTLLASLASFGAFIVFATITNDLEYP